MAAGRASQQHGSSAESRMTAIGGKDEGFDRAFGMEARCRTFADYFLRSLFSCAINLRFSLAVAPKSPSPTARPAKIIAFLNVS